jgi:hypothetical protein
MNIFVLVTGLSLLSAQPYFPIPAIMRIMIGSFQPVAKKRCHLLNDDAGRRPALGIAAADLLPNPLRNPAED